MANTLATAKKTTYSCYTILGWCIAWVTRINLICCWLAVSVKHTHTHTSCFQHRFTCITIAAVFWNVLNDLKLFIINQGASLPVMDLTELPKCTVCLERMDESVNGVLTTLCNHSFHSQCLQRWEDATWVLSFTNTAFRFNIRAKMTQEFTW